MAHLAMGNSLWHRELFNLVCISSGELGCCSILEKELSVSLLRLDPGEKEPKTQPRTPGEI